MIKVAVPQVALSLLLSLLLTSCNPANLKTLPSSETVLVEGDEKGLFQTHLFHYLDTFAVDCSPKLLENLFVQIHQSEPKSSGYQREKNIEGQILNSIIPAAKSYVLSASVDLTCNQAHYRQTIEITGSYDFIPEPYTEDLNTLSLGLLTIEEQAFEESLIANLDSLALEVAIWIKSRLLKNEVESEN